MSEAENAFWKRTIEHRPKPQNAYDRLMPGFYEIARECGLEDVIETYLSGVPLNDIFI